MELQRDPATGACVLKMTDLEAQSLCVIAGEAADVIHDHGTDFVDTDRDVVGFLRGEFHHEVYGYRW